MIAVAADSTEALLWWAFGGVCAAFALFCVFVVIARHLDRLEESVRPKNPTVDARQFGTRGGDPSRPTPLGRDGLPLHTRIARAYRRHRSWRRAAQHELGIRNGHLR